MSPLNMLTNFRFGSAVILLTILGLCSLACGGGGGSSASSSERYSYRLKTNAILPVKEGMTLTVMELGGTQEILAEKAPLSESTLEVLVLNFHINKNYIFAVDMLGMPFLRTTIVASQIRSASSDDILHLGEMNAITTYLTGLLEQRFNGSRYTLSKARFASSGNVGSSADEQIILGFLAENFSGALKDFSSLSYANLENKVVQSTSLFNQRKNRINLLRLYFNSVYSLSTVSGLEKAAMLELFNAFFDETNTSSLLSKLSSPNLPSFAGKSDNGLALMRDLAARDASEQFLFLTGTGVLSSEELRQVYFEPEVAYNTMLLDIAIESPESVIRGNVAGQAKSGATVVLQREHNGTTLSLSTATNAEGAFEFVGVPTGDYQLSASKPGYFFKSGTQSKTTREATSFDINVTIQSYSLADFIDGRTLVMNSANLLEVKDGSISSAKLASEITLSGNFSAAAATIAGLKYPRVDGLNGQVLATDGAGNISWSTPAGTTTFSGNYGDLKGSPVLFNGDYNSLSNRPALFSGNYTDLRVRPNIFSGNYADLAGAPVIPTLGANLAATDVNVALTADWNNTANPWSDNEVSDNLTLSGGNISNTPISGAAGSFTAITVIGQGNISGVMYPSTLGTAGNILKLGSAGNLYWAADATGATVISANAITATELATDSVIAEKIATGAVTTAEILDGTIANADLAGSIDATKITNTAATLSDAQTLTNKTLTAPNINTGVIVGGTINNAIIGGTTPAAGTFTNLTATTSLSLPNNVSLGGNLTAGNMLVATNLTVSGNFAIIGQGNISGVLYPSTLGTAGNILKLGSAGNLYWAADATGATAISANAITATELATDSVGADEIATSAVTTAEILDGTIANADLAGSIDATKITNTAATLSDTQTLTNKTLTSPNINTGVIVGGTINNAVIGGTTPAAGTFTNLTATTSLSLPNNVSLGGNLTAGNVLVSGAGNFATANIQMLSAPLNANNVAITNANIDSGAIDGTTVGATTPATGSFTNLSATGTVTLPAGTVTVAGMSLADGKVIIGNGSNQGAAQTLSGAFTITNAGVATLATGYVTSGMITDATIATADLADSSVTSAKIADGTVADADLAGSISASKITNTAATLSDTQTFTNKTLTSPNINTGVIVGGTINNAIIGGTTPAAGTFTNLTATTSLSLPNNVSLGGNLTAGNVLVSGAGNFATANIQMLSAPLNANNVAITNANIDSGAIDGTTVGATTPATGSFTNLSATGTVTLPAGTVTVAGMSLADGKVIIGNGSNQGEAQTLSGAFTITNAGVATLATGYVTSGMITDMTINTADLADSSVTSAKIADTTIATADLADSSVTSAKISDGTVANVDLAGSIDPSKITNTAATLSDAQILTNKTLTAPNINTGVIVGGTINNAIIGGTTPVAGTFTDLTVTNSFSGNRIGIGTAPTAYRLTLPNESGTSGTAIGYTWMTYSSKRYKENVKEIEGALKKVQQLRGVTYDSKPGHGGGHQMGFIAEEVGEVLPEVVQFEENGIQVSGMDYSRIPALNVQAIKELAARDSQAIKNLELENVELKNRIERLEKLLQTLLVK